MLKFRKKPIIVEAAFFDGTRYSANLIIQWMNGAGKFVPTSRHTGVLHVGTLEDGSNGESKPVASPYDWVIKGASGEFYPVKRDIFIETYEPAK